MYLYGRKGMVIGGASFIVSHLVDHLVTPGAEVRHDYRHLPVKRVSLGMERL